MASIGLRSPFGILATLCVILQICEALVDCQCGLHNIQCQNGCNCYGIDPSYAVICSGGYTYKCNGTTTDHIPIPSVFLEHNESNKLCVFELSNTRITTLNAETFSCIGTNLKDVRVVILTDNHISDIDSSAFSGLGNVEMLNLTLNNLTHTSFKNGSFIPLTKLKTINLKHNLFTNFSGLDKHLSQLTNLEQLYIDGCRDCEFGPAMQKLRQLRLLSFSGRESQLCDLGNMSEMMFQHVPNITHLYVSTCKLDKGINTSAFAPLKNLQLLDMSYNENLTFEGMNRCLTGLINSTSLTELNVNHIHASYERGTMLKVRHVEHLKTLRNLTVLHMDLNKLEVLEKGILLQRMIPASLRYVTLTGNRLTYGKYFEHIFMAGHITLLDISRQHLNFDPFFNMHYDAPKSSTNVNQLQQYNGGDCIVNNFNVDCSDLFIVPKNLNIWKWRKSFLYFKIPKIRMVHVPSTHGHNQPTSFVEGSPNLEYLDLSFNLIYSWQGPVNGVSNITHLDMSENYCQNVSTYFFDDFTGLKELNVAGNFLGGDLHPSKNGSHGTFKKLSKLELLDLSVNKISKLDKRIFQSLSELRYLNINGNMMEDWTPSLANSHCLRTLDLSCNKFTTIPESLRSYLDQIQRSQVSHCNYSGSITLNMAGNRLECTCHSMPLFNWMKKTEINLVFSKEDKCDLPGGETRYMNKKNMPDIVTILEAECVSDTPLIVISAVIITCCATSIVCIAVYRNRWRIRHWYYSKSRRYIHSGFDRIFENDAFISYAKDDASFIKNNLVPALEESHSLKVWVADRNSYPGTSIAENVTHAIYSSRKSVLFVSRKYLREKWCDYEMNMARVESMESKRRLMIIVMYEDLPADEIPVDTLRLLGSEVSLEYPSHPQHLEAFWSSLVDAILKE